MKGRVLGRFVVIAAAILVITVISASVLMAEFVFFKDGSIAEGTIVNDSAAYFTLRTEDKKLKQIQRNTIIRILYTKLRMGKVYIQKRDGKGLVAFMVDEDQETYTFRKELYKPQEFVLKRIDVLFISEKNPSGLQVVGATGTDSVSLSWLPPYDEVKRYNIYIKKHEKDKFELIDSAKEKAITLKKLSGKTTYYLIVTSVDMEDYESYPSNELKITTSAMTDVYLKDGKIFRSYLVTEDRTIYTFRNDLNKPEEFTARKTDVLYITDRNPTALRGEAGEFSISLKWFAPYDRVEGYNIYLKKKGGEYNVATVAGSESYRLKNLNSNTEYTIKVTGIAKDKIESPPSNELKTATKNLSPNKPVIVSVEKSAAGETKIIWQASVDPDGKVIGYKVSRKHKRVITPLAEVRNTEYIVAKNMEFDQILIVSIDDLKAESDVAVYSSDFSITGISIIPSVIFPVKKFKEISKIGYGVSARCDFINNIIPYVTAGVEISFFYMQGESGFTEKESNVKRLILLPLEILAGYTFQPLRTFKITPQLSAGMCYVNYTYSYFDIPLSAKKSKTKNGFDPVFGIGINLRYDFSERLYVTLASNYNIIYEKKENYHYFSAGIGAGMWY